MINLEVKLTDSPGSLVELIKPISTNGGNIYGIYHHHDKKINNMIPVNVTFELPKRIKDIRLKKIKSQLNEKNIKIEKITVDVEKRHIIIILMGHVFDTDIVDTINRLADKGINVAELQAKFTGINEISTVKFRLEFPDRMSQNDLLNEMNKICEEKDLFLIRS
ncbi:MAG: hypothetical protein R6U96_15600 [Promethearchaeia archaeon]